MKLMNTMKTRKKVCSVVTAFVMAFTVFGCTGLSFATEEEPETEAAAVVAPAGQEDLTAPAEAADPEMQDAEASESETEDTETAESEAADATE